MFEFLKNKPTHETGVKESHFDLLGRKVKDKVTGFNGVVVSLSFDLYGCIQAVVAPSANDDGEIKNGHWFDVTRLTIEDNTPVMELPNFSSGYVAEGKKGCASKPIP